MAYNRNQLASFPGPTQLSIVHMQGEPGNEASKQYTVLVTIGLYAIKIIHVLLAQVPQR